MSPEAVSSETMRTETSVNALGCRTFSWSPEVLNFYGDADAILGKIDRTSMQLAERRVFFLLVESATGAQVRFFEQVEDDQWAVSTWQGESLGDLPAKIGEVILANRGVHCVGEQVKALINGTLDVKLAGLVPAPSSPRAAFAHTIREMGTGDFVRASVALLC